MRFRLLPFLMFACFLLLAVKVADYVQGREEFSDNLLVGSGYAESKESDAKKEEAKEEDKKEEGGAKNEEGHEGKAKEEGKEGEKKDDKKKKKEAKDEIKVSDTPPEHVIGTVPDTPQFSPAEIEVLQRLRQRREELDKRSDALDVREKVLHVTEAKIDQKIAELNKLKDDVDAILQSYNQKENDKLTSLVKIYSNMKPKQAAVIFNELDMETLLPVIAKMKESASAAILAQMDPVKAKDVTVRLSQFRKLPPVNPDLQN